MIPRQQFINKLRRDLAYTLFDQTRRVEIYRKKGGTHRVTIPKRDLYDPAFVTVVLRQCGCGDAEIAAFIGSATA